MVRPLDESHGSSPLQGHGSWLMCEVALSFGDPPTKGLNDVMPVASIVESTHQEWKQRHDEEENTCKLRLLDHITSQNPSFFRILSQQKLISYLVCCLSNCLPWLPGCVAFTHPLPPPNRLKVTSLRLSLSTPRSCRLFGTIHT
jgi:hypothetical protein